MLVWERMVINMKLKFKKILMLLVVCTMLLCNIMSVSAVTSETLDTVSGKHAVSGADAKGSFKVKLRDNSDTIKIYQIATIDWKNDSYEDAQWVDAVKTWLNNNSYSQYDTPAKLAATNSSIQSDVLNYLLGFKSNVTGVDVNSLTEVTDMVKTEAKDRIIVTEENKNQYPGIEVGQIAQEAADGYYTVSNVSFGIYAVFGNKNSGDSGSVKYAPLTVAVAPERDGAAGHWYISEEIESSLKASDVSMEKKINGKDSDIVYIGETVDFQINYTLPTYADRDTTQNNVAEYTLAFDDKLSSAFSLKSDTVKVKYRTSTAQSWDEAAEFPTDYYSSIIAGPYDSSTGNGLTVWGCSPSHLAQYTIYENAVKQSDGSTMYYYYYYRDGAYHLLKNDNVRTMPQMKGSSSTVTVQKTPSTTRLATQDNNNGYQIRALYSEATGDTINHGWKEFTVDQYPQYAENIFNISFDYNKIKDDSSLKGHDVEVQITYKAEVNSNAEVGSENNTNTAIMKYETNSSGTTFDTIEDTVHAYTYSVNVVKQDGDTKNYLAGAQFKLFRETDTYCDDEWLSNYDNNSAVNSSLAEYKAANKDDYYYKVDVNAGGDSPTCSHKSGKHTHTRVFKLYTLNVSGSNYFNGNITSVANAAGVTIKGLDVGNYVLKETKTPSTAYNELAEDILFSVNGLGSDEANTTYGGSYKAFKDAAENAHDDGNYTLNILNYKGVTLPSTGGIGTMIFTILGVLIMLGVMIALILKNKKSKAIISSIMVLVLTGVMLAGGAKSVFAVTSVVLNNNNGAQVTGDGTTNFAIEVKDADDTVSVYKIAELVWDSDNETYKDVAWVYDVKQWIATNSTYKAYDTPVKLGEAATSAQTGFLEALYNARTTNNLEGNDKLSSDKITKDTDDSTRYTVKDASYGIYLVVANNATQGKSYQPVTVNVMPTQEGPLGHWFLKSDISTNLKYETIKVEKKVNGKDYDTVKAGEEVNFEITGEVPDYPEKPADDTSKYPLSINDIMSSVFSYQSGSYAVQYNDGTGWKNLDTDAYTAVFSDKAASTTSNGIATYASGNNIIYAYSYSSSGANVVDYYALTSGKQLVKLNSTPVSTNLNISAVNSSEIINKYNSSMGTSVTSFTRQSDTNWTGLYNVTFDYDRLKKLNATDVRVTYKAIVTESVEVGKDTNTNTAYLYYQKDASGETVPSTDTVYVWTYGLNVVKVNGKTNEYLANAKFHLYEEQYEYVPTETGLGTSSTDYSKYTFEKSVDGSVTVPTGYTKTDNKKVDLTTLDKVADVISSYTNGSGINTAVTDIGDIASADSYYRKHKVEAGTECTCAANGTEHYHIVVCKLLKDNIVSVGTADGVTVTGLEPGTYVLKEVEAPAGYNKLDEALIFDIKDIGDDKAATSYQGSHKAFLSDEGNYYEDGIYPIRVANYKGVTLPSTGGIGTLIFTVIGICVMVIAMIMLVVIVRKKRSNLEE